MSQRNNDIPEEIQQRLAKLLAKLQNQDPVSPLDSTLTSADLLTALEASVDELVSAQENVESSDQLRAKDDRHRKLEAELASERFLLSTLMNYAPDDIYFKDTESRFIRISNSLAEFFGLDDPAIAIGKSDFDFFRQRRSRAVLFG